LVNVLDEQIGFVEDKIAASLILAEICETNHFSSDKKLVAWAGLAPDVASQAIGLWDY